MPSLRRDRPFFLLSILVVAANRQSSLYDALEQEHRETLARKMVVEGKKDYDLLEGLATCLTWYVPLMIPCGTFNKLST